MPLFDPSTATPIELVYGGYLQSFQVENEANISGNNLLFLAINDDKSIRVTSTNHLVSAITGADYGWNRFSRLRSLSTKVSTVTTKRSGIVYAVDISFIVPRINGDITELLNNLLDYRFTAIVADNNGEYVLYGLHEQLTLTVLDITNSDSNQYEVKLTATQKRKPLPVAASCISNLALTASINGGNVGGNTGGTGGNGSTPVIVSPIAVNNRFTYKLPFKVA